MSSEQKKIKNENTATHHQQETCLSKRFNSTFDDLARTFDEMLSQFMPMKTWWSSAIKQLSVKAPLVDLVDKGDKYLIIADLPGYKKTDIEIQLNKNTLILTAKKETKSEQKNQEYLHRESLFSSCQRTITFADEIIPSEVDAKMNQGILEVVAPKKDTSPE